MCYHKNVPQSRVLQTQTQTHTHTDWCCSSLQVCEITVKSNWQAWHRLGMRHRTTAQYLLKTTHYQQTPFQTRHSNLYRHTMWPWQPMFSILPAKTCTGTSFAISDTLTFQFVIISFSAVAIDIRFTASEDQPDWRSSSRDWWPRVNSLNHLVTLQ